MTPTGGYGFVSISWSGMAGVVSGMNEHGLSITLNAGASADYRRVGAPTTLLVRRALENARTVDEAIDILTSAPPFISDILGIADASGDVAVLELTPERHGVRRGDLLVATNQLESDALKDDPVSRERQRITTTAQRRERLGRIVAGLEPEWRLGPAELLSIVRDRRAADGTTLPLGHRHAIDALIATHSVIFDATARRIWVSEGPHTLGPYHGYDVARLLAAKDAEGVRQSYVGSLPADPILDMAPLVKQARRAWGVARAALDAGDIDAAERALRRTAALGDHPNTLRLRGDVARARGDLQWAHNFYNQALRAPPEYEADVVAIRQAMESTAHGVAAGDAAGVR